MLQIVAAINQSRRFHIFARWHRKAAAESTGHLPLVRHINQAEPTSRQADITNIPVLFSLSMINVGKLLVIAATVAPKPRLTSRMGKAQHSKVPVDTNSVSQLNPVPLRSSLKFFIQNFSL